MNKREKRKLQTLCKALFADDLLFPSFDFFFFFSPKRRESERGGRVGGGVEGRGEEDG